jgi:hypothetical protein
MAMQFFKEIQLQRKQFWRYYCGVDIGIFDADVYQRNSIISGIFLRNLMISLIEENFKFKCGSGERV